MPNAGNILDFWFSDTASARWFSPDDGFDSEIRQKFEDVSIAAAAQMAKGSHPWLDTPQTSLALIIALDQFPRNMYRGTPAAFAWDPLARKAANFALDKSHDLQTAQERRRFFYLPFMHSEDKSDQARCVALIDQRLDDENSLYHAKAHQSLIKRFGRFPHRNDVLGRASSRAEVNFLKRGGYQP